MHIVYIIQNSETEELYYGITTNLKERLATHNRKGQKATIRNHGIWELVYAEAYRAKEDASRRERKLKDHGRSIQELKKRIEKSLLS